MNDWLRRQVLRWLGASIERGGIVVIVRCTVTAVHERRLVLRGRNNEQPIHIYPGDSIQFDWDYTQPEDRAPVRLN